MKFVYTTLIILCFSLSAMAQHPRKTEMTATVKDTAYVNTYNKLRALYLKQLESESYKKVQKLTTAFMEKVKFDGDFKIFKEEYGLLNWIKDNLQKTSFTSYEEAENEYKAQEVLNKEYEQENAEYIAFGKAVRAKYPKMMVDVMLNKGTGTGDDPKESKEYAAAHDKLKKLLIKQQASASYLKVEAMEKEFYKKANFNYKKDKLAYGQDIYSWVKQNFSKTAFTSLSQAELDWGAIEFAREAEKKENAELHEFQSETLHKFGPEIYTGVMMEVMTEKMGEKMDDE